LAEVKRTREEKMVAAKLKQVQKAAKNKENLFPSILEAVQSYATVGEITDVLREKIGEYCEPSIF
ncbi:MAG TPA: methylmalonyl-CoA mutase, partial [Clostridia bacterium]|nr:methylmalonyl-CoA mutase [Clostridia bacterium]